MTEVEWNSSADADAMLRFVWGKASDRKLRLFLVGYGYRMWHLLHPDCQSAAETVERFAEGQAIRQELRDAEDRVEERIGQENASQDLIDQSLTSGASADLEWELLLQGADHYDRGNAARMILAAVRPEPDLLDALLGFSGNGEAVADGLRCVFGPLPFRRIVLDSTWHTPIVSRLAQTIYGERAFDRLPIFGDALEEAGCAFADILNHCRKPGVHARGCWVPDLLLGKE